MSDASVDGLIGLYLDVLEVERGLAANTLAAYGRDLARFAAFCEDHGIEEAADIDRALLERFALALADSELSRRSAARHISSIRGFVRFCVADGWREDDPGARLGSPPSRGRRGPPPGGSRRGTS